jgi:hypothetical protein
MVKSNNHFRVISPECCANCQCIDSPTWTCNITGEYIRKMAETNNFRYPDTLFECVCDAWKRKGVN